MKVAFIFIIFVSLNLSIFSQTKVSTLNNEDKTAIIKSILSNFFQDYSDVIESVESDEIVLSSLNINSSFVPKQSRVKFLLLSPKEINAKVVRDGFVDYLAFSKFKIKGSKVFVTLESFHSVNYNSEIVPAFGHSFEWEGSRKSGKWKFSCFSTSSFSNNLVTEGNGH